MIKYTDSAVVLGHDDGLWTAEHSPEVGSGPLSICLLDDTLVKDCGFHIDDLTPDCAVLDKFRAYHRGGAAVVETKGVFPFGNEIRFSQVCRYAANHARFTFDFNWPKNTEVKRHLGLGNLFLPGEWRRLLILPPAPPLGSAPKPAWREIPPASEENMMLGHWHSPPLAVVFERPDGTRLEVGTGSDIWRWQNSFGAGPENGSYKIILEKDGIRFIREPLMCCAPFTPPARQVRFTWYMAWYGKSFAASKSTRADSPLSLDKSKKLALPETLEANQAFSIDLAALVVPAAMRKSLSAADFIRGKTSGTACWENNAANKMVRAFIRQLAAKYDGGELRLKGLLPQLCFVPGHVDRKAENGIVHWDMGAILDLTTWIRRTLGDAWTLRLENRLVESLPSLRGIELANGFDPDAVIEADDVWET